MNKKRLIPLIAPSIIFVLNESFLLYPSLFFVSLSLGALILFFAIRYLGKDNEEKFWPLFSVVPIIIFLSFSIYSALVSSHLLIQSLFIASFVFNFYYLRTIYYYLSKKDYSVASQLASFAVFSGFFSIFLLYSSVYLLPFFVNISPILLSISPLIFVYFLFFQVLYFYSSSFSDNNLVFIINTLILLQSSLIISYLPLSAHVLGFLVALIYYFLAILSILNFKNKVNRKALKWPLILTISSVLLLLLSARWL